VLRLALGNIQPPMQWVKGDFHRHEGDHTLPPSADVKDS